MSCYRPIATEPPPKDGTWVLLRGRNAAGRPMIPVVASWRKGEGTGYEVAWRDSGTLKIVNELASDEGADWAQLPE